MLNTKFSHLPQTNCSICDKRWHVTVFILIGFMALFIHKDVKLSGQGLHRVRLASELLLQPVLVRHPHEAVQEGLRHDLQGHRRIQGYKVNFKAFKATLLLC